MTRAAVEIENVSIAFGDRPEAALPLMDAGKSREEIQSATGQVLGVHDCSIKVNEGEILVLMGLSGSGKSTLLRAVNGLNPVLRGAIRLRHEGAMVDVTACDEATLRGLRSSAVSMVFQQFALLPWRTVRENAGLGLELSGLGKAELRHRVEAQLDLVGLADWEDRKVGELSGGMQQRVGLARAFATEAPILLMDEPFSALDPLIRTKLQDDLLELQQKLKRTILFVSHDLDEAFKLGNQIAILEGGRMVQAGAPQDIFNAPKTDYVAEFVQHMNPLGVLRARDVMRARSHESYAQTIAADALLRDGMMALVGSDAPIGVVDDGALIGELAKDDLIRSLARPEGY